MGHSVPLWSHLLALMGHSPSLFSPVYKGSLPHCLCLSSGPNSCDFRAFTAKAFIKPFSVCHGAGWFIRLNPECGRRDCLSSLEGGKSITPIGGGGSGLHLFSLTSPHTAEYSHSPFKHTHTEFSPEGILSLSHGNRTNV